MFEVYLVREDGESQLISLEDTIDSARAMAHNIFNTLWKKTRKSIVIRLDNTREQVPLQRARIS